MYSGKDGEILSINSKENTVTLKSEGYGKLIEIIVEMENIRKID
ncbi:hypothetical protein NW067_00530 [Mycoplasmopsis cynos]|nr:hypothetical protein [Mycoplasmopsis cynos]UWV77918.1 hypothetical protein NW070_00830 [Mycoplasmopsis cynos]UWV83396.1 hypothetical protein NW067_00530 [Mycoplasmopsis cynos]